jgi:FkbM family methyltransferase
MRLDPNDTLGGALAVIPQFYDYEEQRFLGSVLAPGDTFVDVGANVGFYSLVAASRVGSEGAVVAIEADPTNFAGLLENVGLSGLNNVHAIQAGVSDRRESLRLYLNTTGNCGGHSFVSQGRTNSIEVSCQPLAELLDGIWPTAMKLDIEGFEHKVLTAYLAHTHPGRLPRWMIVERNSDLSTGDAERLLVESGYRLRFATTGNVVLELVSP